jgi:hypothetical protein
MKIRLRLCMKSSSASGPWAYSIGGLVVTSVHCMGILLVVPPLKCLIQRMPSIQSAFVETTSVKRDFFVAQLAMMASYSAPKRAAYSQPDEGTNFILPKSKRLFNTNARDKIGTEN